MRSNFKQSIRIDLANASLDSCNGKQREKEEVMGAQDVEASKRDETMDWGCAHICSSDD